MCALKQFQEHVDKSPRIRRYLSHLETGSLCVCGALLASIQLLVGCTSLFASLSDFRDFDHLRRSVMLALATTSLKIWANQPWSMAL